MLLPNDSGHHARIWTQPLPEDDYREQLYTAAKEMFMG
jgi:hypothetical protein